MLYHGQSYYYYIRSQFWRSNYYYSRSYQSQSSIHRGFQKVSLLSYLNSTLFSTLLLLFLLFAADILFLSLIASVSRNSFSNSLLASLITLRLNLLIKLILLGDMEGTLVLAFFFLFFLFFLICFILIMQKHANLKLCQVKLERMFRQYQRSIIIIIIVVMMQNKEQTGRGKKRKQVPLTQTTDVTHILRAINTNTLWKNSSAKLNKTINNKPLNATTKPKKGLMTEEDIDRLFNRSKSKNKTEINPIDEWHRPARDFANSVKFLKLDDSTDKLLNGLPINDLDMDEDRIDALFSEDNSVDLTADFKRVYTVGKVVGQGAYASVRVAMFKPLNRKVAIKVYQKGKLQQPQRKKSVRRQIRILQMLDHPNVVKIYDVVETNNHLNIVMEFLDGIALNNYLQSQPSHRASEKNAKSIVRAIAAALQYLHARQISHRDIKLENVILGEELSPKLIDFGFSTCIERSKKVKIFCGTPSYMAPEIVQKKQYRGQPADVWALGVLTFVTLTGIFPFRGATDQQLYRKINNAQYPRHELYFSKQISDLVGRMLRINPDQRITAAEILSHSWIRGEENKKKLTEISECRKRTTISSHRSKQKEQTNMNATAAHNIRKLTETCQENLKQELRAARQSPLKLNSTYTQRRMAKQIPATKQKQKPKKQAKGSVKVLELLKMGLKRGEDKSKSKSRRF